MNGKLSVIVPVYNKDRVFFKTLTHLISSVKQITTDFEIIVVNDGSSDNTLIEAKRLKKLNGNGKKIKIFNSSQNTGKGYALKCGFFRSSGDPVIFFDGDLDIDSSQIQQFLQLLIKKNADIIVGSKYHPQSRISYPFIRYLYSLILKLLIKIFFNLQISDTQVGLKAFKRSVLEKTMPLLIVKRFAFDVELLVVASMQGFKKIIEVPIVINHNKITSTINFWEVKNFLQDIAAIFYRKNILHFYSPLPKNPASDAGINNIRKVSIINR